MIHGQKNIKIFIFSKMLQFYVFLTVHHSIDFLKLLTPPAYFTAAYRG